MSKSVYIKFGLETGNIDQVQLKGFDYDSISRFGAFLGNMLGADELVLHEVGDDGEGVATIDLSEIEPYDIQYVSKEDEED